MLSFSCFTITYSTEKGHDFLHIKYLGGDIGLCPVEVCRSSWELPGMIACCNVWKSGPSMPKHINDTLMNPTLILAIICHWLLLCFSRILWCPDQLSWSSHCHYSFGWMWQALFWGQSMVESVWITFSGSASHTVSAPWLQPTRLSRDFLKGSESFLDIKQLL